MKDDITQLPNIGNRLAKELNDIGITNHDQLMDLGSVETALKLTPIHEVCINKLYALEGAVQKIRWHSLPSESKQRIKEQYLQTLKKR